MTERPPAPRTPSSTPIDATDDRVTATTSQLAARIENVFDCHLDEGALEDVLLELDRGDYVEWVTITRNGEYVWDLTDSPDRVAEAVAAAVVDRLEAWLEGGRDA